jgi:ECF transporter S component (folate family)
MLIALSVILSFFTIQLSDVLKIGFSFIPLAMGGMLFGPAVGGVMGVVGDILGYFVKPSGPFFPGFTLNALITGAIYGFFFYRRPVTLRRCVLASLTVVIVINLLLNPLWLSILYGHAFIALVSVRIIKNIVMFPINTALLYASLRLLERAGIRSRLSARA